ncbi:MAG: polyamine aminopropyltransferase [Oscillospiraceae bacterium]|nr:polyamine aminopropyltransferase [Oscillospiraceae bacterium]
MDLWFSEYHTKSVKYSIKVDKQLFSKKSDFQRIDIFYSKDLGNILTLDGYLMVTEKDEFVYHEMITHVALAVNPDIKNILVIGAGDGGTIRELTKYSIDSVENIDMVEIDEEVVKACLEYLPQTSHRLIDSRVKMFYEDGLKFVRKKKNEYDLIIIDSTDPFGPGEGLFTKEFYGNCYNALKENGILINQHESPFYDNDAKAVAKINKRLRHVFPVCLVYQAHIPSYPSGHWLFGFASKNLHPLNDLNAEIWNNLNIKTKYYNTDLHWGCFALPNYVKELLTDDE